MTESLPQLLVGGLAERPVPELSVVIPAHNEAPSLELVTQRVRDVLEREERSFELIVVDDGSRDGTAETLERLHREDPRIRARILAYRHGKSAALTCGFRAARGRIVVTMDADLQDLPEEIPKLIRTLEEEELDLVQAWRAERNDPRYKVFASWVFNTCCFVFSGLRLRDVNCGLKVLRRSVARRLRLGDDMHRFIPILVHRSGGRVGEVAVRHARRAFGRSKYGPMRYLRGFSDLLGV
ncbi:MAG: glycosyltransferase family 2 protein, partial [Myxococcota bacterium]|nr:glycosyltransferase family 2 protein [Myxococcota bacterium]